MFYQQNISPQSGLRTSRTSEIGLFALAFALTSPAYAQTMPAAHQANEPGAAQPQQTRDPEDESASAEAGDIVVTGTRLTGMTSPTPVTAIGAAELQQKAISNVSQLFAEVPAFAANQNVGQTSRPVGASNIDLRSLGTARTLLLVDGRRMISTDPSGATDINILPTGLIKQVEIVTGGASAAYGSDAVSGVVNIRLDDRFVGLKADAQYTVSTYGDVAGPTFSLTGGTALLDDRLHLVASIDYYSTNGQLSQDARPWGRSDYALLTNPLYVAGNGQPRLIIAPNSTFSQLTFGGVTALNSIPALRGLQFGPGGTVLPFRYGTNVGNTFMTGGDGATIAGAASILPEIQRTSAFGKISYDLSDSVTVFADALYARVKIHADSSYNINQGNMTIRRTNAFLPQQIATILDANNLTSFQIGRILGETGEYQIDIDNEVQRFGLGVEGSFGDWKWDVTGQLSRATYFRTEMNNVNVARYNNAIDSILVNGVPTCRVTALNPNSTNPDISQCVAANVFGAGSISPAALAYISGSAFADSQNGTSVTDSLQNQNIIAANLSGKPFSTWAGPVAFAIGAEYRTEKVDTRTDSLSQIRGWALANPQQLAGKLSIREAYTELAIPLLRDSPLGQELEINGAARVTDYSTSGTEFTWKVGATYTPFAGLRLRGTYSRDIRAANINELFSGVRQARTGVTNPITNQTAQVDTFTGGNPNLTPERAKSFTVGAVFTPVQIPQLKVSLDYYSIDIQDAITALSAQQVVDGCLKLNQTSLCDAITVGSGGVVTAVSATLLNAGSTKSSGLDLEAVYSAPLGNGDLNFRLLATYIDKLVTTINGVGTEKAGDIGNGGSSIQGPPKWRAVGSVRYVSDHVTLGGQVRYVGGGQYATIFVEGVDIADNSIPSRTYVDVDGSVRVNDHFELYLRINNLFNRAPPLVPNLITQPLYNQSPFYDNLGRLFKVGVRLKL